MDGGCMRIGWQSIKERFIVFGNRKAIYTAAEAALILRTNVHSFGPQKIEPLTRAQKLRSIAKNFVVVRCYSLTSRRLLFVYLFACLLAC